MVLKEFSKSIRLVNTLFIGCFICGLFLICALGAANATSAGYTANETVGQVPLTIQFTDTSSPNPIAWSWNFGDETRKPLVFCGAYAGIHGDYAGIYVVNPDGAVRTLADNLNMQTPPIAADLWGNVYYFDEVSSGSFSLFKLYPDARRVTLASGLGNPGAVMADPYGTVYYSAGSSTFKMYANGTITTLSTNIARGLVLDSSGNLYVEYTNTIYGYYSDGTSRVVASLSNGMMGGIGVDGADNIYVANVVGDVHKVYPNGTMVDMHVFMPSQFTVDSQGNMYTSYWNSSIRGDGVMERYANGTIVTYANGIDSPMVVTVMPSDSNVENPVYTFNDPGMYHPRLTVMGSDGSVSDVAYRIIANGPNGLVVSGVPTSASIDVLSTYSFMVMGTDDSIGHGPMAYSLNGAPAGASINYESGVFSWTPNDTQVGDYTFNVTVYDGVYRVSTPISLHVNAIYSPPTLSGVLASAAIDELSAYTFTAVANDTLVPAPTLTFGLDGASAGASIDPSSGVFSWTPSEVQGPGDYSFSVTVSDGVSTVSAPVSVHVNEVNSPPALSGVPASAAIDELSAYTFTAVATDSDVPVQALTFGLDGAPAGASIDPSSGVFSWTPREAQGPGDYAFNVTVSDGVSTVSAPVSVHVNEVNSRPVLSGVPAWFSIDELSTYTFTAVATDSDVPVQALTFGLVGAPAGASIDPSSGVFTWTPSEVQGPRDYQFRLSVSDGISTVYATVAVDVNEVNSPPVLSGVPRSATVDELSTYSFTAVATDSDIPVQALTFGLQGAPVGASINVSSGVFTWTPGESQGPGDYAFNVTVSDGVSTVSAPVSIRVNEVNSPPMLSGVPASIGMVTGVKLAFVANAVDSDVPVQALTFSLSGAPRGASIDPLTGAFAWTPSCIQTGNYTFSVVVTDNGGKYDPVRGNLSASSNITVSVDCPPIVVVCGPLLPFNSTSAGKVGIYYLLYGVKNGNVSVSIVNKSTGALVRSLPVSGVESSGLYSMVWDGRSDSGAFVPEGYYDVKVVLSMSSLLGTTVSSQWNFLVDNTPPVISISSPSNGITYTRGQAVYAIWNASDSLSGVAYSSGTADNGKSIDTSTVGSKSFTVTARDLAGNMATKTVVYTVQDKRKTNN